MQAISSLSEIENGSLTAHHARFVKIERKVRKVKSPVMSGWTRSRATLKLPGTRWSRDFLLPLWRISCLIDSGGARAGSSGDAVDSFLSRHLRVIGRTCTLARLHTAHYTLLTALNSSDHGLACPTAQSDRASGGRTWLASGHHHLISSTPLRNTLAS